MKDIIFTPHFSLSEYISSVIAIQNDINNYPPPEVIENLGRLSYTMEKVRTLLNSNPILITSGYRCPELNKLAKGAINSVHLYGLAVDFICPGYGTPLQICQKLENYTVKLEIDQLIHEFGAWVHLGLSHREPRHMLLTINRHGVFSGIA